MDKISGPANKINRDGTMGNGNIEKWSGKAPYVVTVGC